MGRLIRAHSVVESDRGKKPGTRRALAHGCRKIPPSIEAFRCRIGEHLELRPTVLVRESKDMLACPAAGLFVLAVVGLIQGEKL